MTIVGDKCHIEVDYGADKIAIFGGELGTNGFYADKNSMKWKSPHDQEPVSESERTLLISMIEKQNAHSECKVFFNSETISREELVRSFFGPNSI